MTREEAILLLHDMKDTYDEIHENTNYEIGYEQMTALDMAIEALSADAVMRDATAEERESVQKYIDSISTEAVQVVRCKDCRHYIVEGITTQYGWCHEYKHSVDEDDYCSYGERRKE